MTDMTDLPVNPPTPWEFLPNDDAVESATTVQPAAAEEAAMHVTFPDRWQEPDSTEQREPQPVVHYLEDEHPEIPDPTQPAEQIDTTGEVDDLLIRQHYLPPGSD